MVAGKGGYHIAQLLLCAQAGIERGRDHLADQQHMGPLQQAIIAPLEIEHHRGITVVNGNLRLLVARSEPGHRLLWLY